MQSQNLTPKTYSASSTKKILIYNKNILQNIFIKDYKITKIKEKKLIENTKIFMIIMKIMILYFIIIKIFLNKD